MMSMTLSANKLKLKIITRKPELSTCEVVTPRLSKDAKGAVNLKKCGISVANGDKKQVKSFIGVKRAAEEMHSKKKIKMDGTLQRKCSVILKKLMTHQCSWPFLQAVDPISLRIPDYFSIISKPMDLGTVKSKLDKNLYTLDEDFKADVRLIFSNAMRYNAPANSFHQMAKELDELFSARWRFNCRDFTQKLDGKSSKELSSKKVQRQDIKHNVKISKASKLSSCQSVSLCAKSCHLVEYDSAKQTPVKSTKKGSTQCTEVMKPRPMTKALTGEKTPPCDIRVSKKSEDESGNKCKAQMSKSDHDSDGAASCLDEEHANATLTSVSSTPSASEVEWKPSPIYEDQLSADKDKGLLRAAMLKRRFADTIFKAAQQQTTQRPVPAVRLDEEKMRLERRQQEASNQGKLKSPLERLGLYLKQEEEEDELVSGHENRYTRDDAAFMDREEGEFIS